MEIVPDARVGGLTNISTIYVYDSLQERIFYPNSMLPNPNPEHSTCMLDALDLRQDVFVNANWIIKPRMMSGRGTEVGTKAFGWIS